MSTQRRIQDLWKGGAGNPNSSMPRPKIKKIGQKNKNRPKKRGGGGPRPIRPPPPWIRHCNGYATVRTTILCACLCVCVCMYVCMYLCMYLCMYVCVHTCGHGGGWRAESRYDLCYILHNVTLSQKSAMLCLYVCVCVVLAYLCVVCMFVCVCVETCDLWSIFKMSFKPLPICHCVCVCVWGGGWVSVCCACLFACVAEARHEPWKQAICNESSCSLPVPCGAWS